MSVAFLASMLSAGFLGSWHCVGMCGGLVAVASEGSAAPRARLGTRVSYQAARLLGYLALGVIAGALGQALDLAGRAAGVARIAAVVAGGIMTVWGLVAMLHAAGQRVKLPELGIRLPLSDWLARSAHQPALVRAALLGGASALLPCGFLYAFAFAAAATGSPSRGALVMACLWLGNLPALVGFGFLLTGVLRRFRRHVPLLSAAGIFALGLLTVTARVNLPAFAASSVTQALGARPMPEDCPFHRGMTR